MKPQKIDIAPHTDDRGFLYQIFGNYNQLFPRVQRVYVVGSFGRGIVRGFHKHLQESKCYFVAGGVAKFVVVDGANNISTFVLSLHEPSVLLVPPGHFHGWVSLADNTLLIGLSDKTLEESLKDDIRMDPFAHGKKVWEVEHR